MLALILLFCGVAGVIALLSLAIIWTVKLGIAIPPPGDVVSSQTIFASSRFYLWPVRKL